MSYSRTRCCTEAEATIDFRLIQDVEIQSIVPLLHRRNPSLSLQLLSARVAEMGAGGFQCFGAYHGEKLIGIAGFWIRTRYHTGKVIEPDAVFVDENYRSRGIGARMCTRIIEYGRQQQCLESELHCYVSNTEAHQFWINRGYRIIAFHFAKDLQVLEESSSS
jgi:GNAT superfamily N-acetyltransferase